MLPSELGPDEMDPEFLPEAAYQPPGRGLHSLPSGSFFPTVRAYHRTSIHDPLHARAWFSNEPARRQPTPTRDRFILIIITQHQRAGKG